jgi:glycosyltransferase involved in cell wall biosynthesis
MKIKEYLYTTYGREAAFIAYGCQPFTNPDERVLQKQGVIKNDYCILVARMEAENNIAMILEGYTRSNLQCKLLVVGNLTTDYGRKMEANYGKDPRIIFTGGIYDLQQLNNLRYFSRYYFHGHSVGGTNPSLLEAMASGAFIIAHGNEFNEAILGEDARYFTDAETLSELLNMPVLDEKVRSAAVVNNDRKVKEIYNWDLIATKYEALFVKLLKS